jgi:PTS system galactitol-specific IIA component
MINTMIAPDCILVRPDLAARNSDEVIKSLCARLQACGYVGDSYCAAVIEREKQYPTGLPTQPFAIALPHADHAGVLKSALALAVLEEPVTFRAMDFPTNELPVRLVLLLAVANPENQMPTLRWVLKVMQDREIVASLVDAHNPEDVLTILAPIMEKEAKS